MLKKLVHSLARARQLKINRELAVALQQLEYRHETASYLEYKLNSKELL